MTTLIKNVQLIDGTGKSAVKADVLIKGKVISAVGNLAKYRANQTIEGMGAYLCPGFIDIHSTADRYLALFSPSEQKNFLRQGVTTIIGGQDGLSLAPLIYGSLDLLRDWVDTRKINVNWHTFSEFLEVLSRIKMEVNFGTLVGHKTIEHSIKGDNQRSLSASEIKVFSHILERALGEGALGFSMGSDYFNIAKTGFYDIKNFLRIIAKHKALFSFNLQGEGEEKFLSLKRLVSLIVETGVKSCLNHTEPIFGSEPIVEKILAEIGATAAKTDLFFEVYPGEATISPVYAILPPEIFDKEESEKGNLDKILEILEDKDKREEVRKKLPKLKINDIKIISVPGHGYLEDKLLRDYGRNRGLTLSQALLHLIRFTGGRAIVSYKNINTEAGLAAAINDRAIIASADGHSKINKEYSFLKFIRAAVKNKIMPIETAARKLTALPAARLGIKNRGVIKVGNMADIVVFKDYEVKQVMVNGKRAVIDGKINNVSAGKILRAGG